MYVGIANPRWRGKRPRHSRCMHNPQFFVPGKLASHVWPSGKVIGGFRREGWAMRRLDFLNLILNSLVIKQSRCSWFDTLLWPYHDTVKRCPTELTKLAWSNTNKQRVLMHGHQGWNVRHGLCHIYMIYVYIWVVYSFCLFCCLLIIVTTQFVALYKPCKPKPKPSTYDPPGQTPPGRDPNSDT